MEPVHFWDCDDWAVVGVRQRARLGCVFVQSKMCAGSVVIGEIRFENPPKLSIVQCDDMVSFLKTLSAAETLVFSTAAG